MAGLGGILLRNGDFAVFSAVRLTLAETEAAIAPEALAALHDSLLLLTGLSVAGLRSGLIHR